jgi:hypothetical protein
LAAPLADGALRSFLEEQRRADALEILRKHLTSKELARYSASPVECEADQGAVLVDIHESCVGRFTHAFLDEREIVEEEILGFLLRNRCVDAVAVLA